MSQLQGGWYARDARRVLVSLALVGAAALGVAVVLAGTRPAEAAAKAYLIDVHADVTILDMDADAVVGRSRLFGMGRFIGERDHIVAAPADGLLFAVHDREDLWRVATYTLQSLAFKRDLDLGSAITPKILVPPVGPHFFVAWQEVDATGNPGRKILSRFDKATLTKVGEVVGFPFDQLGDRHVFSKDGTRLYTYGDRSGISPDTIRVFDTASMQLLSTIDPVPLFAPNLWGKAIEDVRGDRALLVENVKAARLDPSRLSLFTIRLPDGARSPKIVTGLEGDSFLAPLGDKIVFSETETIRAPAGHIDRVRNVGRLHVYGVETGTELGQVAFPVVGDGEIAGIRPRGDKLYFQAGLPTSNEGTLTSLSLTTYTVVKAVTVLGFAFMVFVDP